MKISRKLLKSIIKEEVSKVVQEENYYSTTDDVEDLTGMSLATQTPAGLEDLAVKAPAKKRRRKKEFDLNIAILQARLNLALEGMESSLPPLVIDGVVGKKTREAMRKVRKAFPRNKKGMMATLTQSIVQASGMDEESLKREASRIAMAEVPMIKTMKSAARDITGDPEELERRLKQALPTNESLKESFKRYL